MSLSTNVTLTVNDYDIKLSRNLKFYENDQLKLIFTLNYWGIDNAKGSSQRVLMPLNALTAILFIETPLGIDSLESATVEENVVTFYLTSNQTQHIGISRMQIQLLDADGCQITLPPMNFEVRENIYDDEVILSEVLLADEDENIVVDENGNAVNTGTQVSAKTYAIALSAEDETTATTSQPTKQIKDFNLKIGASGLEDLLIQDSDGVTKRIKTSEFLNVDIDLTLYYTKEEIDTLLNNKANISHTHTVADIEDMLDYALKTDIPTVPTKTSELTNDTGFITTIPTEYITESELNTELSTKANKSEIPSLDGYATETYVQNKIAEASLSGGEVDLSAYATKAELNTKADKTAIPTKVSQLTNDKGYLTSHQDISGKADKTYVDAELAKKANVSHTHSYNDLTDKPTIPSTTNLATKTELTNGLATKANKSEIQSLEGYATETFVTNKIAEASLSGGEVDLSGLATKAELATKADISSIPTKTSQLNNDSGFITSVPSEYITESELDAKGYLTEHQDISGKANISDLSDVATSGNYNDLINTPTIPNEYILPIASTTTLGGIKVGSGLSIDTNGVLSATDTGGTVGNGIIFNDSYIEDCNRWLSNGYVKTRPNTSNLPALCTGVDRWGVLFFIAENATDGTGTQMYFPIDGTYKGRVFTRSLTAMSKSGGQASEWVLLAIQSDIPSIDGLATETYVNNKMIPNLVGNTATNKTLTLTVDKYQYAVLSNGDSIVLPSVSSFTEIHLFFKASADLTLTFPSVRWQSIPSITSGHTYEIIFTYVVDEWLAGVICYE